MEGRYLMRTAGGSSFDVRIDPFTLAVPGSVN
jgi:uncharacterized protein affecting Mg2+/Co2+ transport